MSEPVRSDGLRLLRKMPAEARGKMSYDRWLVVVWCNYADVLLPEDKHADPRTVVGSVPGVEALEMSNPTDGALLRATLADVEITIHKSTDDSVTISASVPAVNGRQHIAHSLTRNELEKSRLSLIAYWIDRLTLELIA